MNGSRTIRVVKRDGSAEAFVPLKLAGAMWRGMHSAGVGEFPHAAELALAIRLYLRKARWRRIPSAALFEMAVKVLRRVGYVPAAEAMETWRCARSSARDAMTVAHEGGKVTLWDKSWLARLGGRTWFLTPSTARTLAGMVEDALAAGGASCVGREEVLNRFGELVSQYGLADAVPVRQA